MSTRSKRRGVAQRVGGLKASPHPYPSGRQHRSARHIAAPGTILGELCPPMLGGGSLAIGLAGFMLSILDANHGITTT